MNINDFVNALAYPFMSRAIVVGVLVSLCASLLGVILVLKRYSLIGHGLSDVGFASLSLAMAVGVSPVLVATPFVIVASFIIMYVSQSKKLTATSRLASSRRARWHLASSSRRCRRASTWTSIAICSAASSR